MIDLVDIDERIIELEDMKKLAKERGDMRGVTFFRDLISAYEKVRAIEKTLLVGD